jgi:hypothetical protein
LWSLPLPASSDPDKLTEAVVATFET